MALSFIRHLYSLDTLDTRFVVPATSPPKEALQVLKEATLDPASPNSTTPPNRTDRSNTADHIQPPRWRTNEFYLYYIVISASVFFMFKLVLDCSKGPPHSQPTPPP